MVTVYELQVMMGTFFFGSLMLALGAIIGSPFIRARIKNILPGQKNMVAVLGGHGPKLSFYIVKEPLSSGGNFEIKSGVNTGKYVVSKKHLRTFYGVSVGLFDTDHGFQLPWTALYPNERAKLFDPTIYSSTVDDAIDLAETQQQQLAKKPDFFAQNGLKICVVGIIIAVLLLWTLGPKLDAIISNQQIIYELTQGVNASVSSKAPIIHPV